MFNTAAFSDPAFAPGNSPRNITHLHGPFSSNENLAMAKRFNSEERVNMELPMEFFNVLNRMQVCAPDNTVTDGANKFGLVRPNGTGGSSPCQANTPWQGLLTSRSRSDTGSEDHRAVKAIFGIHYVGGQRFHAAPFVRVLLLRNSTSRRANLTPARLWFAGCSR